MRLLFFTPQICYIGGIERTLTDKANYLVQHGCEVMIVTYLQKNLPNVFPLDDRVRQVDVDCPYFSLYQISVCQRISAYRRMLRSLRRQLRALAGSFLPDVVIMTAPNTEFYLRVVRQSFPYSRFVVESHLSFNRHFQGKGGWDTLCQVVQRPRTTMRHVDLLIALTEGDAGKWKEFGVRHVSVIPNPLPFTSRTVDMSLRQPHRMLCVGGLRRQKRFDRAIDAFALLADKYPEWQLDIIGDGELHAVLQEQIACLGLEERIRLLPSSRQMPHVYQQYQFLVVSSDAEGFGLVIIEAMACGLPVVSTDCPYGPSEIIDHGVDGLLCNMDTSSLAAQMEWMIIHPEAYADMSRQAVKKSAQYELDGVMPKWLEAYSSVVNKDHQ